MRKVVSSIMALVLVFSCMIPCTVQVSADALSEEVGQQENWKEVSNGEESLAEEDSLVFKEDNQTEEDNNTQEYDNVKGRIPVENVAQAEIQEGEKEEEPELDAGAGRKASNEKYILNFSILQKGNPISADIFCFEEDSQEQTVQLYANALQDTEFRVETVLGENIFLTALLNGRQNIPGYEEDTQLSETQITLSPFKNLENAEAEYSFCVTIGEKYDSNENGKIDASDCYCSFNTYRLDIVVGVENKNSEQTDNENAGSVQSTNEVGTNFASEGIALAENYISNISVLYDGEEIPASYFTFDKDKTDQSVKIVVGELTNYITFNIKLEQKKDNVFLRVLKDDVQNISGLTTDKRIESDQISLKPFSEWQTDDNEAAKRKFTIMVGEKNDSNGDSKIDENDEFASVSTYILNVSVVPYLWGLEIVDENQNDLLFEMPEGIETYTDEYSFVTSCETITFAWVNAVPDIASGTGVSVLYIGNNNPLYHPIAETEDYITVKLKDYTLDGSNIAEIPIRLDVPDRGVFRTITIRAEYNNPSIPTISEISNIECDKNTAQKLQANVKCENEGILAYQWFFRHSKDGLESIKPIEGATGEIFDVPTDWAGTTYYTCEVTNTIAVDGEEKTYTARSNEVTVTVKLSEVSAPEIKEQLGTYSLLNLGQDYSANYKTEYVTGQTLDTMFIRLRQLETGTNYSLLFLRKKSNSNETETLKGSTVLVENTNVNFTKYKANEDYVDYAFTLAEPLPVGEYDISCIITATDAQNPKASANTLSNTVHIIVADPKAPLSGSGTEKDPYLITSGEDLEWVRAQVTDGVPFAGIYFKFKNDVTLPDPWQPIGCTKNGSTNIDSGRNLNPFSGNIDGDNFTLTVPEGSTPLLGYVRGATVKNLKIYGTQINGYGLVNNFEGVGLGGSAIVIDNCTLKSGTQTLKSGFLGANITSNHYAGTSAGFTATIRNCTVESGVVIGYTGTYDRIGSIAGRFQGTIENCVSYATVKGTTCVGGLVGSQDQAMGKCAVYDSSFHGIVTGSGAYVGGIVGSGYDDFGEASAPNGGRPTIQGCSSDGSITGASCVGGILGGDQYVAQTWDNVISYVTGNTFTGSVSGSQYVGGIIGYYDSLNRYDNVSDNVYSKECGAKKGIGFVKYLDTSYENPGTDEGTVVFNTAESTANCPKVQWCAWKAEHNRTDDPLGVDAAKLTRVAGESEAPTCYRLEVTGSNYKKTYTVGEELDLSGIELTAYWSNKTTTKLSVKDVTVSGYNKNTTGTQTIILTYGAITTDITVTVNPKSTKITVTVSILGDSHHGKTDKPHGLARGGLTSWAYASNIEADSSETVWDVLKRVMDQRGISVSANDDNQYGSVYISAVNGLGEFDNGPDSGWMYTVNGSHPNVGVSARYVKNGDVIVLHYTDDYTYEEGGNNYNKQPTQDNSAVQSVIDLINKIGTVKNTAESKQRIDAARKAYNALTDAQKRMVSNLQKLVDAEIAYAKLSATEEDKKKAQAVIDQIKKLGTITLDSEKNVQAARKAYNALTELQKKLVENYDVLTASEAKLAMLKGESKVDRPYTSTGDYMEALGTPSVGAIGGEWMVIGLARSDRNVPGVEDYYKKVLEYVAENIDPETGRLHKAKSTDNSRIILALTAIGRDVTNVGGYDLLQGLSDLEFVKYQGNNGPIWALLALDSGNYPAPAGGTTTRQTLIDEILRVQTSDGGWAISGDKADSDMTGMALTALAPYYKKNLKVQEAIDKAIARLSEMQDEDGGYSTSYDGTTKIATSESISQVVTALSALGINADTDPRFIKDGGSAIDALLRYYVSGGGFRHVMDGAIDGMGTEQAYYALTAYYRFLTGKTNLYDMTDVIDMGGDPVEVPTEPTVPATTEPTEVETGFPWWILVICVVGGCGLGMVIAIVIIPKFGKFKKKD